MNYQEVLQENELALKCATQEPLKQQRKDSFPTVLFVDDEEAVLRSLRRLFRRAKYNVLQKSSAKEALREFEKTSIDLVVSDMRMPEMNGAEFLSEVAERWPNTLRICLTGYADLEMSEKVLRENMVYKYLFKPWDDDELLLTVKQLLERNELGDKP